MSHLTFYLSHAYAVFRDVRGTPTPKLHYKEVHSDDVTEVCLHAIRGRRILLIIRSLTSTLLTATSYCQDRQMVL